MINKSVLTMTNVFIARHGETEYNRLQRIQGRGINEPLNERGRRQARCVAVGLGNIAIDRIFSSSLKRSVETAEIIGNRLELPVRSFSELDEMDFGVIEGRFIEEVKPHLDRLHTHWRSGNTAIAAERGESPEGVLRRVLSRMELLLEAHRGGTLLFVLHGRLIRILLAHWLQYGLSQMHRVEHQNCGLYHLRIGEDEHFEPVYLNRTDHLKETG